jgi:hypothetical protein
MTVHLQRQGIDVSAGTVHPLMGDEFLGQARNVGIVQPFGFQEVSQFCNFGTKCQSILLKWLSCLVGRGKL